jgi:hypothetical protein
MEAHGEIDGKYSFAFKLADRSRLEASEQVKEKSAGCTDQ